MGEAPPRKGAALSPPPLPPPLLLPRVACLVGQVGSFTVRSVVHSLSRCGGGIGVFKPTSATGASTAPQGGI